MMAIPTRTERLLLSEPSSSDVDDLFIIQSDPAAWAHLPQGRHTELAQTQHMIDYYCRSWEHAGLGSWVLRLAQPVAGLETGTVVGSGGLTLTCQDVGSGAWNLGYRMSRLVWGNGLATELCAAALAAGAAVAPERPVTARVLERNPASFRVLEKAGLTLVWWGEVPSDDPDPELASGVLRRVYADRPLSDELLAALIAKG